MLIIMVAHIQWNPWASWIPAQFGPSDAAEMFVLCSGYAAALAFGATFIKVGFWHGVGRILLRCWQIYWAHLGLFFAIAAITVLAQSWFGTAEINYIGKLNLGAFFDDPATQLVGLLTLTYVPNYFDILPMYFVILLMTPIVIALQRLHLQAAIAFCVGLYLLAWGFELHFPAEPWSSRPWFFNPLCWQLLFFTAFMLARGWIEAPPFEPWLLTLAALYVILMIPLSHWQIHPQVPLLGALHDRFWLQDHPQAGIFKTNLHPLRYLHILALAYLAVWLVKGREQRMMEWPWRIICTVGQQALATFLAGMTLSWMLTIALDQLGRDALTVAAVNILGLSAMVAVAYAVAWFKSEPWRRAAARPAAPPAAASPGPAPEGSALGNGRCRAQPATRNRLEGSVAAAWTRT